VTRLLSDPSSGDTARPVCLRAGCDNPAASHANARYCSNACKSAAYKDRTGYWLTAHRKACQTRKRSGRQLSYRKTVDVLAAYLAPFLPTTVDPWTEAESVLRPALSDRQRRMMDEHA
jgi:hypothetical protein